MVSRSEIDLLNIRREFIEKYDKSLHQAIEVREGLPSGLLDYRVIRGTAKWRPASCFHYENISFILCVRGCLHAYRHV